jgi:hypothetical protein
LEAPKLSEEHNQSNNLLRPSISLESPKKLQRQVVAHRLTKGGNSYQIQINHYEPDSFPASQDSPDNKIEITPMAAAQVEHLGEESCGQGADAEVEIRERLGRGKVGEVAGSGYRVPDEEAGLAKSRDGQNQNLPILEFESDVGNVSPASKYLAERTSKNLDTEKSDISPIRLMAKLKSDQTEKKSFTPRHGVADDERNHSSAFMKLAQTAQLAMLNKSADHNISNDAHEGSSLVLNNSLGENNNILPSNFVTKKSPDLSKGGFTKMSQNLLNKEKSNPEEPLQEQNIKVSIKKKPIMGYRTLNYANLLKVGDKPKNLKVELKKPELSRSLSPSLILPISPESSGNPLSYRSKSKTTEKRYPAVYGNRLGTESCTNPCKRSFVSQNSIAVCDNEELQNLGHNNYSSLNFSIQGSYLSADANRRKLDRGVSMEISNDLLHDGRTHHPNNKKKLTSLTVFQNDPDPVSPSITRHNKNLDTTYVYKTEVLGPKQTSKEIGISVNRKVTQINQYVMISIIGRGNWGEVYLAIDSLKQVKHVMMYLHRLSRSSVAPNSEEECRLTKSTRRCDLRLAS